MNIGDVAASAIGVFERRKQADAYKTDPAKWVYDHLGMKMSSKQREIAQSLIDNRGTLVASAHGQGKTFSEALIGLWWVNVFYDDGVFLATTAPSAAQVNIFWDYLKKFHGVQKARYEVGDSPTPPVGYITGQNQWKDDSGIIIGEGRKPPEDKSDVAFQGRHAPYLLVVADEAVGVPKNLIDAMGNLATGDNNRQLLVANPTTLNCEMYRMWKLSETDPEYGKNWNRVTISVLDSPLIKEDPYLPAEEADGMAGWAFYDQKLKDYGSVDDPRFLARVLGQWAQDDGSTVFTMEEVSRAMDTVVIVDDTKRKEVGVDISGLGDDYSVVYLRETGEIWKTSETGEPLEPTGKMGFRFRQVGRWNKTPLAGGNELRPDSAMKVNELVLNYGAMVAKIDASGIGMAVIQGITGSLNPPYTVVSVFGGAAARDPRTYVNSRAELFFDLKLAMQRGEIDIDPDDDMLREQMETLRYEENENKKIKIESKDSMRRRGVKSPDELDTVAYAFKDVDDLFEDRLDPGEQILLDLEDMEFDKVRNGFLM